MDFTFCLAFKTKLLFRYLENSFCYKLDPTLTVKFQKLHIQNYITYYKKLTYKIPFGLNLVGIRRGLKKECIGLFNWQEIQGLSHAIFSQVVFEGHVTDLTMLTFPSRRMHMMRQLTMKILLYYVLARLYRSFDIVVGFDPQKYYQTSAKSL